MEMTNDKGPSRVRHWLAFVTTGIPANALILATAVYLPRYFATHVGLSLALVGSVFAVIRMIDVPVDPLLGMTIDRTHSRYGRYRLWMLASLPLLCLSVVMLFLAPPGAGPVYLIIWLIIMYLGSSMLRLSQSAWAASLGMTYDGRSKIFAWITGMGVAGAIAVLLLPIITEQMGLEEAAGVQGVGGFIVLALIITIGLAVVLTRKLPDKVRPRRVSPFQSIGFLKNRNVARLIAADLCVALGAGWMSALYLFYFRDGLGFSTTSASLLLLIYVVAGLAGVVATTRLATKYGKHRAFIIATVLFALSVLSLAALPAGSMAWLLPTMIVAGGSAAGFEIMLRAMTGDIGDELNWNSGHEQTGLIYALTSSTTKIAGALAIFLSFQLLSAAGYQAKSGVTNAPDAIKAMEIIYIGGPVFFALLGALCFVGYPLTAGRHAEIRRKLDEREVKETGSSAGFSA
jgi:glycoside/pentoside/hexuronide:cation symporter, GPH family